MHAFELDRQLSRCWSALAFHAAQKKKQPKVKGKVSKWKRSYKLTTLLCFFTTDGAFYCSLLLSFPSFAPFPLSLLFLPSSIPSSFDRSLPSISVKQQRNKIIQISGRKYTRKMMGQRMGVYPVFYRAPGPLEGKWRLSVGMPGAETP